LLLFDNDTARNDNYDWLLIMISKICSFFLAFSLQSDIIMFARSQLDIKQQATPNNSPPSCPLRASQPHNTPPLVAGGQQRSQEVRDDFKRKYFTTKQPRTISGI
jgi:hypothetical protein